MDFIPWVLAGDFNAMLRLNNKEEGRPLCMHQTLDCVSCVNDCSLVEFDTFSPKFTWEKGHIKEKIDWVLCNTHFKLLFP